MTLPCTIPHLSDDTSLHNSSSFWWHCLTQFLIFLMTLPYTISLLSDDTSLHNSSSFWWHQFMPSLHNFSLWWHLPYTVPLLYGDTFLTQFLFFLTASVYAVRTQFFTQFFFLMKLCGHCDFFLWLLRSLGIRSHRPHSDHCCAVIGYLPLRSLKSVSLQCFSLFKWQLVSKQFFFSLSSSV